MWFKSHEIHDNFLKNYNFSLNNLNNIIVKAWAFFLNSNSKYKHHKYGKKVLILYICLD